MNLEDATISELKAAINKKLAERLEVENAATLAMQQAVLDNIDMLLTLTPEHDRTSCSDDNPYNFTSDPKRHIHRCTRCQLLKIKEDQYNDEWVVKVELVYKKPSSSVSLDVKYD